MTEINKIVKPEFSVNNLKGKLARAFGCSDWDDLIKKSSPGFIEEARNFY